MVVFDNHIGHQDQVSDSHSTPSGGLVRCPRFPPQNRPNESEAHRKPRTALRAGATGLRRHVEQERLGTDWYPSLIHPTL